MTATIVLLVSVLLMLLIVFIVARAIVRKQQIIGRPPVHVVFFVLAKSLVILNLTFLFMKGLNQNVHGIFVPNIYTDSVAIVFLILGTLVLYLSTFRLNKDLIFGLSSSETHKLQTQGIYSISRHPFYLGFICILFSSCLLSPHYVNILAFVGAWLIHHFIMIKEEEYLTSVYGEDYKQYAKKTKRYISF
jgi:protein-S-isoprenylcysteine O-methyltransferase Ste14